MTIAAVLMGAAVLDVPRRGDVLVIKERVGHLTTRGRPMATTLRRVFVARADLGCAIRARARGRRLNGLRAVSYTHLDVYKRQPYRRGR